MCDRCPEFPVLSRTLNPVTDTETHFAQMMAVQEVWLANHPAAAFDPRLRALTDELRAAKDHLISLYPPSREAVA